MALAGGHHSNTCIVHIIREVDPVDPDLGLDWDEANVGHEATKSHAMRRCVFADAGTNLE